MLKIDRFGTWTANARILLLVWALVLGCDSNAFSQLVGTKLWEFAPGNTPLAPAIDGEGNLYFGSGTGYFIALTKNGVKKWEFNAREGQMRSSAVLSPDGTVLYFGVSSGLFALGLDGSKKFEFAVVEPSAPAVGLDGTVYFGSANGRLHALAPQGAQRWEFDAGSALVASAPVIGADGTIYVGSSDRRFFAILPDGRKKWEFLGNGGFTAPAAIGLDGTLYVGSEFDGLYAISPDGKEKWKYNTGNPVYAPPTLAPDGTIYLSSSNLYALTAEGILKWTFPKRVVASAVAADGTVYVGSDKLYAIDPNGPQRWAFAPSEAGMGSPIIGSDGTIYCASSSDRKLYAIKGSAPPAASSWPLFRHDAGNAARVTASPVALVSPTSGATFAPKAEINLKAVLSLTQAVQRVDFLAGTNLIGSASTPPYTFNWTNAPLGTNILTIRAVDIANQSFTSPPVSILVASRLTVRITNPQDQAEFLVPAAIPIFTEVNALDGRVLRVEFFQSSNKIGEALNPPYSLIWTNVARGDHVLTARAADDLGAVTTSAGVRVRVTCPGEGCETTWIGAVGDWFNPAHWNPHVPFADELASINNNGQAETSSGIAMIRNLVLGRQANSSGHIVQRGGTNVFNNLSMAAGPNSRASYYGISGALIGSTTVGSVGSATFTNLGGFHFAIPGSILLGEHPGSSGTYHLGSDGRIVVGSLQIGGAGAGFFRQTGGRVSSVPDLEMIISKQGGPGSYDMSGGEINGFITYVGYGGSGTFQQSGGTNRISAILYLGYFGGVTGTYDLSETGVLTTTAVALGSSGTGLFNQRGGTHTSSRIYLGDYIGGRGTYTISGGQLTARELVIGDINFGHFNFASANASVVVSNVFRFGTNSQFSAVPGSQMLLKGNFENLSTDPRPLAGLTNLTLILESSGKPVSLEASADFGSQQNFALGKLVIGRSSGAQAIIVDQTDNDQSKRLGDEVFAVHELFLARGSVLNLNGLGLSVQKQTELPEGEIDLHGGKFLARQGLALGSNASVVGGGSLIGSFTNSGRIDLGSAPGILRVEGNYTQSSAGQLSLKIGGVDAGAQADQIRIAGTAQLAGGLTVRLTNGFQPAFGQSFPIMQYGSSTGEFSTLNLPPLTNGLSWKVVSDQNALILVPLKVGPPVIIASPTNQTVLAGSTVTLRVTAIGEPAPNYQWQFNGANLPGAISPVLLLTNALPAQSGSYQAIISNASGSVSSGSATLVVSAASPPTILEQPLSQKAYVLDDAVFSVTAMGVPPPAYQWQYNGTNISGATSNRLTLARLQPAHAGLYGVVVGNQFGEVTSAPARLELFPLDAIPTVAVGNPGNPTDMRSSDPALRRGAVDYEFRIGKFEVNNLQYAAFLNAVAKSDSFGLFNAGTDNLPFRGIERSGVAGQYQYAPKPGMEFLPVTFTSFYDVVRFANWLHNGRPVGFQDESTTEAGAYILLNQRKLILFDNSVAHIADVSPRMRGARWFLPNEDEWYKAAYYDPVKNGFGGYWLYATRNDNPPVPELPPGGTNSANYLQSRTPYQLSETGAYRQSSSAYGTRDQTGNLAEWTESQQGSNRTIRGGAVAYPEQAVRSTYSEVSQELAENYGFRIAQASSSLQLAPVLNLQPSSRTVLPGQSATFVVQAAGQPEPSYQWELNSRPIAGATGYTFTIPSVQPEHVGNYSVIISNALGTIRSEIVQLATFPTNVNLAFWGVDADGLWSEPANWFGLRTPRTNDYVVIDRPSGAYTVTYGGDARYLHSLFSNEPFVLLSSILNVSNTIQVNHRFSIVGGILQNATVLPGALSGRSVDFNGGQFARLHHVAMNADMDLARSGILRVSDGLILNGTARVAGDSQLIFDAIQVVPGSGQAQAFSGTGQVLLGTNGGGIYIQGETVLTIARGMTIRGGMLKSAQFGGEVGAVPPFTPGMSRLINEGEIRADARGGALKVSPHSLINRGVLAAESGATLNVFSSWTNYGFITATNASVVLGNFSDSTNRWSNQGRIRASNSIITLSGTFDTRGLGDIERTGGEVRLVGQLDNRGNVLALDARWGSLYLVSGSILGGTVTTANGAKLVASPMNFQFENFLVGLTVEGELDLSTRNAIVKIQDGIILNGPVSLHASATIDVRTGAVRLGERAVLSGDGKILGNVTNSGAISPGSTLGKLQITGDLIQTTNGRLQIQLDGTNPVLEYDRVDVTGKARLAGHLDLELMPGFVPQAGHSFTFLMVGLRQNTFNFIRLPLLSKGLAWKLSYGISSVTVEVVVGTDADRDGMFDQWEALYGLNPALATDGAIDLDGDGMNNLQEFSAGTDPRDPSSAFRISGVTGDARALRFQASAVPGKRYQLQSKESVNGVWTNAGQPIQAEAEFLTFTDESAAAKAQRFYRVAIVE
jgi:formylglycine-generating enzyme required for sulfatase activity